MISPTYSNLSHHHINHSYNGRDELACSGDIPSIVEREVEHSPNTKLYDYSAASKSDCGDFTELPLILHLTSINPNDEKQSDTKNIIKMDPNQLDPNLPPIHDNLMSTRHKKVKSLIVWKFLVVEYLLLVISSCWKSSKNLGTTMEGKIVGIPWRHSCCWVKSWNKNKTQFEIVNKYLITDVMKCDQNIKNSLVKARKKFNNIYPNAKTKQTPKHLYAPVWALNTTSKIFNWIVPRV